MFIVSGIWHGAGYTFIVWGAMHGIAMVIYRLGKKYFDRIPTLIIWIINFVFISLTWVFFRADTLTDAIRMIESIFSGGFSICSELTETLLNIIPISIITNLAPLDNILSPLMLITVLLFIAICIFTKNAQEKSRAFVPNAVNLIVTFILLMYSILSLSGISTFLYFNF